MSTYLKSLRKQLGLTQDEAAFHCGVSRQMWSEAERGRALFSAQRVQHCKDWGPLMQHRHRALMSDWRERARLKPYEIERVSPEPWQRCWKRWAWDFRELDRDLVAWMSSFLECDSALEALGWLQLAGLNASGLLANPHELGFRHLPIVDRQGQVLGERCLAALTGHKADTRFIAWPQVRLRPAGTTYRADGLVLLHRAGRCRWLILEFDGPGHLPERDAERQRELGLSEIRLTEAIVRTLQVCRYFLQA